MRFGNEVIFLLFLLVFGIKNWFFMEEKSEGLEVNCYILEIENSV